MATRKPKRIHISEKDLISLYFVKQKSLREIGKMYNLTASGVLRKTKKYNMTLRKSWETNTSNKIPFSGSPEEKAYILGFRQGDLGIRLSSFRTKRIQAGCNTTKIEQVELIYSLFNKYSKVWISQPNSKGASSVSTILDSSFSFLLPKGDHIDKWIKTSDEYLKLYISGYIDAEGSFGVYQNRARFRIGSYDKMILKDMFTWLTKHNIKAIYSLERKRHKGQNNDFWRVSVNDSKSLLNLYDLLFGSLNHKKRRLDFLKCRENIILRLNNGTIRV